LASEILGWNCVWETVALENGNTQKIDILNDQNNMWEFQMMQLKYCIKE